MKKMLILTLMMLICFSTTALASQAEWVSHDSKLNTAQKIIIFPAEGENLDSDVTSYVVERSKKVSQIQFSRASVINEDLLKYTSEKDRAQKVAPYANFYIVPVVKAYHSEREVSPGKNVSVRMERWREIHSSEYNWTSPRNVHYENYWIPEAERSLSTVEVDFYVYNTAGEPVLMFNKAVHTYDSRMEGFKDITKEFYDILKRAVKN